MIYLPVLILACVFADPTPDIVAVFDATPEARTRCVESVASALDNDVSDAKLSELLHRAARFPVHKPGVTTIAVPLEDGSTRDVIVRVPAKYSADKPWPIVFAFHGTGGAGAGMLDMLTRYLGARADEFILACPDQYNPANIDSKRSWRPEQRLVIQTIKKQFHIDSDRVYVTGFSAGGYMAWSHALYYGDEFAAAVPVACAFDAAPEIPRLYEMLLPNVQNVYVLNVWGANDRLPVLSIDLQTAAGTNDVLNKRLAQLVKKMNVARVTSYEVPKAGHEFVPPMKLTLELFAKRRDRWPKHVEQRFRYLNQGRAYWLEALAWEGDQWGLGPRTMPDVPGQSREQAIAQMLSETLAKLSGTIEGQNITIERAHVGRLAVWFGEGMIDFDKPVRVTVNGQVVFDAKLKRDVRIALMQAARTCDFERLRWAGLLIDESGDARPITLTDNFPDVVWEKPAR